MKKAHFYQGCRYGFGRLLTHFMKVHKVEEEALYYIPILDTCLVDGTQMRDLDITHMPVLILLERHAQDNKITACMYMMQMLQLRMGGRPTTREEIRIVDLNYLLGHYVRTLLRIGSEFVEPIDDDIPTHEKR